MPLDYQQLANTAVVNLFIAAVQSRFLTGVFINSTLFTSGYIYQVHFQGKQLCQIFLSAIFFLPPFRLAKWVKCWPTDLVVPGLSPA